LKLETQFLLDQAEADNKTLQGKLVEWKQKGDFVLEPGEEPPLGYEATNDKHHGN
jgi:hypothetical protein